MEQAVTRPSGKEAHEYLLLLPLPEMLEHKIEKSRRELAEKYRLQQPPMGRPHVSLGRFTATPGAEEKILYRLQCIALAAQPFLVTLQDFGSYPMHSIFIRIANQPRVLQLIRQLQQARPLMKAAGEAPYFVSDPNIVLAGRMPREKYLDAMKEYLHKHFTGRFLAEAFLVLRKGKNEKRFQVVKRFSLEHLPVGITQGQLFG